MLILNRKVGERIFIGEDITILVKEVRANQVWLGIGAPRTVRVDREEVWMRRQEELRDGNPPQVIEPAPPPQPFRRYRAAVVRWMQRR